MPLHIVTIEEAQRIAIRAQQYNLRIAELVAITWDIDDGPIYYCHTQLDETLSVAERANLLAQTAGRPVEVRLLGGAFQSIPRSSDISDDTVSLDLYDGDEVISDLFLTAGEGVRVEVFIYLPEFNVMLSQYWGHLKMPDEGTPYRFKAKAANGFRSPLMPLPRRAFYSGCQAHFGGKIFDLVQLAENDCPYDIHVGGAVGNLNPSTGLPYTGCPRNTKAACTARIGDDLSFLAFDVLVESKIVSQSKGPNLLASTRGNESNLKRPLRVIYGHRIVRDLDLLAYRAEPNTNHPDKAALSTLWAVCEGSVFSQFNHKVKNTLVKPGNIQMRNGALRQSTTGFSANASNYSGTACFYADIFGDWRGIGADDIDAECEVYGRDTIRVYTTPTEWDYGYTTNRAWCLLDVYHNKRYGHGVDTARFHIQDWIDLAAWFNETIYFNDVNGDTYSTTRNTFNADLGERTVQEQVRDICRFGRCSLPFLHNGKIRIVPLKSIVIDNTIPLFTDYGDDRNIVFDNGQSMWSYSQKSDAEIPNIVVLNFDDEAYGFVERAIPFEDEDQMFRAGRAFGDNTIRRVEKSYGAFGITNFSEVVWNGEIMKNLGEFDEGGILNNLRVKFTTWSVLADVLDLHPYAVIQIRIRKLEKFGFDYFRIIKMDRRPNLQMEITAQAYPVDYYDFLERSTPAEVIVPEPPEVISIGGQRPGDVTIGGVTTYNDQVQFQLSYL